MLFAVPDYIALGLSGPFYCLLAYRLIITTALVILFRVITTETDIFKISYPVTALVIAGFTGFMLFFVYRPDMVYLIIVLIMFQIMGLLIFIPIRFIMALFSALYAVLVTMVTRVILGTTTANLVGLFFLLALPAVIGAATAIRLAILQRRQFALLSQSETMNMELQKALKENKQLSGLLPICASCKKIRDDKGYWNQIESYLRDHSEAEFSHSLCPECARKLYPEFYDEG